MFLCFALVPKLVPRTMDFHWYWYRILKFWYRDNTNGNISGEDNEGLTLSFIAPFAKYDPNGYSDTQVSCLLQGAHFMGSALQSE